MSERGRKWLLWSSVAGLLFSIAGLIYFSIYDDRLSPIELSVIALIISGLNIVVIYSIKYLDRKWLRKSASLSLILLPLFSIALYFAADIIDSLPDFTGMIIAIVCMSLIVIMMLLALVYIFIIRDVDEVKGVLALLLLIILSVIFQRFQFTENAIEDMFLPGFIILTTGGIYIFGLYSFMIIERNKYLKITSLLASILTSLGSYAFLYKMMSGRVSSIELIYFIPAFIMTLVVLFTLPFSGYINWISLHKKILKKIIISWVFFLLIFSMRFVFPDFFVNIALKEKRPVQEFSMKDYTIVNKNGLEPD